MSLAALTYAVVVDSLFRSAVVVKAHSTGLSVEMVILLSLIAAVIGGLVVGLISGVIGVAIKNRILGG